MPTYSAPTITFDLTNGVFIFEDTNSYSGAWAVDCCIQIQDPAGTFYNNLNNFGSPDIEPLSSTTNNSIALSISNFAVVEGTYAITYQIRVIGGPDAGTYTVTASFTYDFTAPTITIEHDVDCRCSTLVSKNLTSYGDSSTYVIDSFLHTIKYPGWTGTADITTSASQYTVSSIANGTFTTVIDVQLTYSLTGYKVIWGTALHSSLYETSAPVNYKEVTVDCNLQLCKLYCGMKNLISRFEDARADQRGSKTERKLLQKLILADTYHTLYWWALDCGTQAEADAYLDKMSDVLGDCCSGCGCSDDQTWITPYCGVSDGGGVTIVQSGTGTDVTSVTVGSTTTYTVNVSSALQNLLATLDVDVTVSTGKFNSTNGVKDVITVTDNSSGYDYEFVINLAAPEDWHEIGDSTDPLYDLVGNILVEGDTGSNNVSIDGSTFSLSPLTSYLTVGSVAPQVRQDIRGYVELKGSIDFDFGWNKGSVVCYPITVLPQDYRPESELEVVASTSESTVQGVVKIFTNGAVAMFFRDAPVNPNVTVNLDSIKPFEAKN